MYNSLPFDFWSAYMLPSGTALAVFYLLYKGLVRNDSHLNTRRFVILGFLMFAMALPFLNFEIPVSDTIGGEAGMFYLSMVAVQEHSPIWLNPVTITGAKTISMLNIIGWIYLIGVVFLVSRGFIGVLRLVAFSRKGKRLPTKSKNIVLSTHISTAFSFFNRIFIPETWYNGEECNLVLSHEEIHVKQKHSWDLMLMEIICMVQFFNPFVWLLKREMRLNHEFLADRGALEQCSDKHYYFQLLLQKVIGKQPILVHSFNYSPIKHRIMMQIAKPARLLSQVRYLAFVPLVLALTFLFACQEKPTPSEDVIASEEPTTISVNGKGIFPNEEEPLVFVDGKEIEGGLKQLKAVVSNEDIMLMEVLKDSLAIAEYGERGANGVILISTKSKVPQFYEKENKQSSAKQNSEDQIFQVVEDNPNYPGGEEARQKYLADNIVYPATARESNIKGTIYITFVVEKDGSISDVKVVRGIGGGCDEEAVRVVKAMPKWIPGKQRGQNVRVQFMLPIKFTLG
ncbi:MAG: TonB family protein [Bacteroidales bacterium]|jgi:TonB family protein|nr:TonB family protein [Bacteroidales bacterium]